MRLSKYFASFRRSINKDLTCVIMIPTLTFMNVCVCYEILLSSFHFWQSSCLFLFQFVFARHCGLSYHCVLCWASFVDYVRKQNISGVATLSVTQHFGDIPPLYLLFCGTAAMHCVHQQQQHNATAASTTPPIQSTTSPDVWAAISRCRQYNHTTTGTNFT